MSSRLPRLSATNHNHHHHRHHQRSHEQQPKIVVSNGNYLHPRSAVDTVYYEPSSIDDLQSSESSSWTEESGEESEDSEISDDYPPPRHYRRRRDISPPPLSDQIEAVSRESRAKLNEALRRRNGERLPELPLVVEQQRRPHRHHHHHHQKRPEITVAKVMADSDITKQERPTVQGYFSASRRMLQSRSKFVQKKADSIDLSDLLQDDCKDKSCELCRLSGEGNNKNTQTIAFGQTTDFFLPSLVKSRSFEDEPPTAAESSKTNTPTFTAKIATNGRTGRRRFDPHFLLSAEEMEAQIRRMVDES